MNILQTILQRGASPIAVDVGAHSIKMLQLTGGADKWSVAATAEYAMPIEGIETEGDRRAVLTDGLRRLVEVGGFAGRSVVAAVPEPFMRYKNLRLPRMDPAERDEAVRWEAADRLELGDAPAQVEHIHAGEVRNGEEVRDELILMAALQRDLAAFTEALVAAGLKPLALEPTVLPLLRCFSRTFRREADQREPRVIVDLGADSAKVLIVRDGATMFFKRVDIGGRHLDRTVAEHLGMEIEEAARLRWRLTATDHEAPGPPADPADPADRRQDAVPQSPPAPEDDGGVEVRRAVADAARGVLDDLCHEVGLCLRYFSVTFRGKRPEHVWLTGGGAHDGAIRRALEAKLDGAVRVADPFEGMDLSGPSVQLDRRGRRCEWAVAVGLALRPDTREARKGAAA